MFGIILGIALFMFLVIIHELGHFITAKKSGVKVLEFGIGIPPKAFKYYTDKSGTEYTINRIPLGGFVRLKGEDPKHSEDFNAPDSFIKAKMLNKIIILIGGVTANFIFARIVFTSIFTIGIRPISIIPDNALIQTSQSYLMPTVGFLQEKGFISGDFVQGPAKVEEVMGGLLGENIGLKKDDIILSINQSIVNSVNISQVLQRNIGQNISITLIRDQEEILLTGRCPQDNCLLGIIVENSSNIQIQEIRYPFPQSIKIGLDEIQAQTKLTLSALGGLLKNVLSFDQERVNESVSRLTGPVGAVKFSDMLRQSGGWIAFLAFGGIISLALAIFNILPIPALDGGRLLGVLIQGATKMKAEKYFNIESYLNLVFFILLMGLGIYIIFKDLYRFRGISLPWIG